MSESECKTNLINDLANNENISAWIEKFITSDIDESDKIDILKYKKSYFENIDTSDLSDNHKTFLELIQRKKYVDAARFSSLMSPKREDIKQIIKSRDIYFLSPKLEIEMGGLGRTVLYRAKFLADQGYNITLLNIGPVKNYPFIKKYYENRNLFSKNINFINIFEHYSKKNSTGEKKENFNYTENENVLRQDNRDNSVSLKYFSGDELEKTEIYIDNCLVYIECKDYNKYLTKDGFIFLLNDKINKKFYLSEKSTGITFEFNNRRELLYHFIEEVCFKDEKPFIVCDSTHHWYNLNVINLKNAFKIGALHGTPFVDNMPGNEIKKTVNSLVHIDEMSKVVLLTNDLKKDLIDIYDPNKLVVIPNFVFEKDLEYDEVEKDVNKVSCFTRISSEKQISHMIRAFEIITKQNNDVVLEIYGGASSPQEEVEENYLKQLTKELKLEDRVIFKGFTSDIKKPMRESIVTLLSSKYEGLPLSIMESMTNSTAVISYDCYYGPSELITNKVDGIIIEQDNIDELAAAILRLVDNPEIAIEMGKKGKEKMKNNYTLSNIAPKWEDLFIDIYAEAEINDFVQKATLKDNYDELSLQNESLRRANDELDKNNSKLKNQNHNLEKSNSQIKDENKELKKFKKEILSSTSWKITGPLRKITQLFK